MSFFAARLSPQHLAKFRCTAEPLRRAASALRDAPSSLLLANGASPLHDAKFLTLNASSFELTYVGTFLCSSFFIYFVSYF